MARDLGGLAVAMQEMARRVERNTEAGVRRVALAVDQAVVFATPVDTGRARSNWIASVDKVFFGTVKPYAKGEKLGLGERANAQAALSQAAQVVAGYKLGSVVYIANNLPYIRALNDGWSAQAPAGFVEAAVQAGSKAARDIKVTVK